MQNIEKLKSLFLGPVVQPMTQAIDFINTLDAYQASSLIDDIDANAYWEVRGVFKQSDSPQMLAYLAKVRVLLKRGLTKGKFQNEVDEDGLTIVRQSTQLTLGEYQRTYLLNTSYIDFISIDFSHVIYVDFEQFRLLKYCEGDVIVHQADSLDMLTRAIGTMIDCIDNECPQALVHESTLTKLVKLKANV